MNRHERASTNITAIDTAPSVSARAQGGPELSVVVPTFNERENVRLLFVKLDNALAGLVWEVIFVDDNSPDGTAKTVRDLAGTDFRARCIQRIGRRGLSSACIEGILSSSAPYIAIMDADLQHDETLLPRMLHTLKAEGLDVVVGSRYVDGGGIGNWADDRAKVSRIATDLARIATKVRLQDPMSGFFMTRREVFEEAIPNLSSIGFKVLLDLFASSPKALSFKEIPFEFRTRQFGESKLDSMAMWEFLMLLLDKTAGRFVPVRLISFAAIGGSGVVVHMLVLSLLQLAETPFIVGQAIATAIAMTSNFFLNNLLTYRDRRLKGWQLLRGWASFSLACSIGAVANVGVAGWLYEMDYVWFGSALAGILVGTVWNYAVTAIYTWKE